MNSIPTTDEEAARKPEVLEGDIPSPVNPPKAVSSTPAANTAQRSVLMWYPKCGRFAPTTLWRAIISWRKAPGKAEHAAAA
ncbi:MAG: hypothetical protein ACLVHV_12065 [Oscillospiraceae bacterium]